MIIFNVLLIITLVTASFFVGIIAAMFGVIQHVLNQLDYATYTQMMQGIIESGRKSIVIWSLLLIPVASASIGLFILQYEMGTPTFKWLLIGLSLFILGPILVSRYYNEPYYNDLMGWSTDVPVNGWQHKRSRWFRLNLIRFTIGALACTAFALALSSYT